MTSEQIIAKLKQQIEASGDSLNATAIAAGMNPQTWRAVLAGERDNPGLKTVCGMADALGLELRLQPISRASRTARERSGST